jgi:hypothetical protein
MQKGLLRRRLPGAAVPAYVALDLCYISRLKLWFLAGRCARALRNFPCRKIAACWQFVILLGVFMAPELTGLRHVGALQTNANATARPKISSLQRTI